jgi:hypothetical protein
MVDIC